MRIDYCDGCEMLGEVRRLELGGGSGLFLCEEDWKAEMIWRVERNTVVTTPFDIVAWEDAAVLDD